MADDFRVHSDLPLEFRRPPGWPTPTRDWVESHQGWAPPSGWVPPLSSQHRCPPAPAGWVFWAKDSIGWPALAERFTAPIKRSLTFGIAFIVGALVLTFGGIVSGVEAQILFWFGLLWGSAQVGRALLRLRRVDTQLMAAVIATGPLQRRRAYTEYLASFEPTPW